MPSSRQLAFRQEGAHADGFFFASKTKKTGTEIVSTVATCRIDSADWKNAQLKKIISWVQSRRFYFLWLRISAE